MCTRPQTLWNQTSETLSGLGLHGYHEHNSPCRLAPSKDDVLCPVLEDIIEDEASSMENEKWVYGENIVYCRDTFFCCDHRQSAPDAGLEKWGWEEELRRRREMRRELFPTLH